MDRTFQATTEAGLNFSDPVMTLWEKGKQLGVWDPATIDFSKDGEDWASLSELEQTVLLHLTTLFIGGEEAVALESRPDGRRDRANRNVGRELVPHVVSVRRSEAC